MAHALATDFWRGRRVFLTGHSGFKGGWLAALLHRLGATVSGYALEPPAGPNLFEALDLASLVDSRIGDIRDVATLTAACQAATPEVVFHLAAQPLVRHAFAQPADSFATNVIGTVNLLEAARVTPSVKAIIVVTSDKVYDNQEWPWAYRETDRLGGKEPYGASKAAAEMVVQAYRHSYFSGPARPVALASVRAGNVIGGGDWAADRLVPDAMRAFQGGMPLVVRNPAAVRPWQHVLDPLAGYCTLAEAMLSGKALPADLAFNFGPEAEDARPVSWLVERLCALWGKGAAWELDQAAQPYEARLLEVDSARARACLGWRPAWRLEHGLARTLSWYRRFYDGQDMRPVTFEQIEEYLHG